MTLLLRALWPRPHGSAADTAKHPPSTPCRSGEHPPAVTPLPVRRNTPPAVTPVPVRRKRPPPNLRPARQNTRPSRGPGPSCGVPAALAIWAGAYEEAFACHFDSRVSQRSSVSQVSRILVLSDRFCGGSGPSGASGVRGNPELLWTQQPGSTTASRGSLRSRNSGPERAVVACVATVVSNGRPSGTSGRLRPDHWNIGPAGPGGERASIQPVDAIGGDGEPVRRWRERSRADRGFGRQPALHAGHFRLGVRHGGAPHPYGVPGRALRGQDGGSPMSHPHLLAHEF